MSNRLTKILTYCSLVLVILAVVITTAICLTTALSYKVKVDVVIQNVATVSPDANVTVNINGKEVSTQYENTTITVDVQKDREATLTFSLKDYEYVGLYNGTKDTYQGTESILAEPEEFVYKFSISQDTNYTLVVDAAKFYQVNVAYIADKPVAEVEGGAISVVASGESVYADKETTNSYWAKEGTEVSISYVASEYEFTGWTNGENTSAENVYVFTANTDVTVSGNFEAYVYYNVDVKYEFDEEVAIGNIVVTANGQTVAQDGIKLKVREGSNVTLGVVKATGYDFVGWTNVTENPTSTTIQISVSDNASYVAEFNAIKYTVTFDDGSSETYVYGAELKDGPADVYENGWKVFQGWSFNGKTYTEALFEGTAREVTVSAVYKVQSEIPYTFNVSATDFSGAGTISYNTTTGLVMTNAPTRDYYNLVGIVINGTEYRFDGNSFTDAQNTIDRYLVGQNATSISVAPIWELAGAPIIITLPSESDFSGNTDIIDQLTVSSNIETIKVTEFFGIDATQVASFEVQYNGSNYTFTRTNAEGYANISMLDIFAEIGYDASVSTELTFVFTSNV